MLSDWRAPFTPITHLLSCFGFLLLSLQGAAASDVRCIEESKYKYLYQLFDNDRRKFADYFGVDPAGLLPEPEFCRAALLSGSTGEPGKDEFADLVRLIVRNRGWLAAIHLSSGGGSGPVFPVAFLIRKLRIKTVVAQNAGNRLVYDPDFAPPPASSPSTPPSTTPAVCFLKDGVPARVRLGGVVSGVMRSDPAPTYEVDVDLPGRDFRNVELPRTDPRLCQQRCQGEPRCRAWTYNGPPRVERPVCWLKASVPPRERAHAGTVSGVHRSEPVTPTFEAGIDLRGQDYRRVDLPQADGRLCQQLCREDERCRAWAYNGPGPRIEPSGWERFRAAQRALPAISAPIHDECASSCSFFHAGGADRSGMPKVHRPSPAREMEQTEERQIAGEGVRKFYRAMDAGEELIRIWEATNALAVRQAPIPRFPRYLNDFLLLRCGNDAEGLQRREAELLASGERASLQALALVREQRIAAEQCVAREFEQARLLAFEKLCGRGCDPKALLAEMEKDVTQALNRY